MFTPEMDMFMVSHQSLDLLVLGLLTQFVLFFKDRGYVVKTRKQVKPNPNIYTRMWEVVTYEGFPVVEKDVDSVNKGIYLHTQMLINPSSRYK